MGHDDDFDFDQLMAEEGATRMGRARRAAPRPKPGPRGAPAPVRAPAVADPRIDRLEDELREARQGALERDRRIAELEARLAASQAERDALAAKMAPLEHEVRTSRLRVEAAEGRARSAEDRLARAPAPTPAAVEAAEAAPASETAPTLTLAEALAARGVAAEEQLRAVAALGDKPEARSLLDRLVARDPEDLGDFLDRRLALVCGAPACEPQDAAAVLLVDPARCDVCGGSDIQRAAGTFASACAAAGLGRVRVIGGSPAYRTQLEHLFPKGGPLTLLTMKGDKRVSLSRSKRHQSKDDLVIVWGATELDHATSGAYRAAFGRVMVIAHRGIARMLELAAERITTELSERG